MDYEAVKEKGKTKAKHRKGLWSPEEDQKLRNYILNYGHGCWSSVPIKAGLQRNGKSCRLRWINYLRTGLKRGMFSHQEEETILTLHHMLGNKWSQIAQYLPGRTDNEIKNLWHSCLKKKVAKSEVLLENQAHNKTHQCTNSSSDHTLEYSSLSSTQKSTTDPSSYELPFPHSELRSVALPEDAQRTISPLPKLLFAEWLSLENNIYGSPSTNSGYDQNSNFQDASAHGVLLNDEFFNEGYQNMLSQGQTNEIFSSQFKFEDQISNGFGNSGDMSSDLMYI